MGLDRSRHEQGELSGGLTALILVLVCALAAGLRFFHLSQNSLWVDEGWTYFYASLPLRTLWSTPLDTHPPIYYSLVGIVAPAFNGEFALRLLSVLFGIATVPVAYALGHFSLGRTAGLVAALALALSSVHLEYSQEARSYALVTFLMGLSFLFGLLVFRFFREERSRSKYYLALTGYLIFSLLAIATHIVMIYYVFAGFLSVVLGSFGTDRDFLAQQRLPRLPWVFILVNAAIAAVWLLLVAWLGDAGHRLDWLRHASPYEALHTVMQIAGYWHLQGGFRLLSLMAAALCLLGVVTLLVRGQLLAASFGIFVLGLAPLLIWLTGFYQPIFILRTILPSVLGAVVCIGAICLLRPRSLAVILLLLYFLPAVLGIYGYFSGFKKADWRSAVHYVEANADPGAAILLCYADSFWVVNFYLQGAMPNVFTTVEDQAGATTDDPSVFELDAATLRPFHALPLARIDRLTRAEQQAMLSRRWPEIRNVDALLTRFDEIWVLDHVGHCKSHQSFTKALAVLPEAGFQQAGQRDFEWGSGIGLSQSLIKVSRYRRPQTGLRHADPAGRG